jgi:hypothetical protein
MVVFVVSRNEAQDGKRSVEWLVCCFGGWGRCLRQYST